MISRRIQWKCLDLSQTLFYHSSPYLVHWVPNMIITWVLHAQWPDPIARTSAKALRTVFLTGPMFLLSWHTRSNTDCVQPVLNKALDYNCLCFITSRMLCLSHAVNENQIAFSDKLIQETSKSQKALLPYFLLVTVICLKWIVSFFKRALQVQGYKRRRTQYQSSALVHEC